MMYNEKRSRFPVFETIAAIIVFLFHYTDFVSISIGNAAPFLFIPLAVSVCMYYSEITAVLYGLCMGSLLDCTATGTTCFNTLFFMLACFISSMLIEFLLNRNFAANIALCLIISVCYFALKWLILYFIPDVQGKVFYFFNYSLVSALYTTVFIIPLYFYKKKTAKQ